MSRPAELTSWTIELRNATGDLIDCMETDEDGKYSFCELLPGNYTVSEVVEPGYVSSGPTSIDIELECDNSEDNNFDNIELLCINGTKLDNCTGLGLANWTIELKDSNGTLIKTATTGTNGTYSFCGLEPGNYTVSEVVDPNYIATGPTSIDVELECDNSENNDFKNTELLCINGTKKDASGLGLDNWTIILQDSNGTEITRNCLLYTSPSPRDRTRTRMPSSA